MRTLRDIMTTDCETVTMQETVYEVAAKMKGHDVGFMPVVEGRKLLGVITDRDLVIRGLAERKTGDAKISEIISKDLVTAAPETTVEEAAKMMAGDKVRRLPVVENGNLVGIVAIGDLAVRDNFEDEAGEALGRISEPVKSR